MVAAVVSFACRKVDTEDIDDEEKLENALAAADEELTETANGPVLKERQKASAF